MENLFGDVLLSGSGVSGVVALPLPFLFFLAIFDILQSLFGRIDLALFRSYQRLLRC